MEAAMRAGYDGVAPDTRRAPIPDLPRAEAGGQAEREGGTGAETRSAVLAISAVFAVMLLFAIGAGYYTSRTVHPSVTTSHLDVQR
jgi:hypothetical protein